MKTEEEVIAGLANHVGSVARQNFLDWFEHDTKPESPIERVMLAALHALPIENVKVFSKAEVWEPQMLHDHVWDGCTDWTGSIHPQVKIGNYRVDFYLQAFELDTWVAADEPTRIKDRWLELIIECDGHDYHERTKEQARADKQRDRWFQIRGIQVLRFAGSEIWANPLGCAEQVEDAFFAAWRRYKGRDQ